MAQDAAKTLGVRLLVYEIRSKADLDGAFMSMAKDSVEAFIAHGAPIFLIERERIAALA